jgi:predicted dinucleotide-binding enzyme
MKIGILGTGVVGGTIGAKLVKNGHSVMIGARQAGKAEAKAWASAQGPLASEGSFADAAAFGALVFHCGKGALAVEIAEAAGAENLAGKILIELTNPLDFSKGMPPSVTVPSTDSMAERIQARQPKTKVVKTLNTLNCNLMVQPGLVPGDHNLFVCGNDLNAKEEVKALLSREFGWKPAQLLDLGGLSSARGLECLVLTWVSIMGSLGHANFNWHIAVGPAPQS